MEEVEKEFKFDPEELALTCSDILQDSEGASTLTDTGMRSLISDLLTEALNHLTIRAGWLWIPGMRVNMEIDVMRLGSLVLQVGPTVAEGLRGSLSVALFVATCGEKYDLWSNRFFEVDDPLSGFLSDSIGLATLDKTIGLITKDLEQMMSPAGLNHTSPFSPGFCGWESEESQALMTLLPTGFGGLRIAPDGSILPINSRCGIIGLGEDARPRPDLLIRDDSVDGDLCSRFRRRLARRTR